MSSFLCGDESTFCIDHSIFEELLIYSIGDKLYVHFVDHVGQFAVSCLEAIDFLYIVRGAPCKGINVAFFMLDIPWEVLFVNL